MSEEYVRKDVFDVEIRRIEETAGGAIQDLRDRIDDLKGRLDDIKDRIDDIRHAQTMSFARWGLFITACVCVIQVLFSVYISR